MNKIRGFFRPLVAPTPVLVNPGGKVENGASNTGNKNQEPCVEKPIAGQIMAASSSGGGQIHLAGGVGEKTDFNPNIIPPVPPMHDIPEEEQEEISREFVKQLKYTSEIRTKSFRKIKHALDDSFYIFVSFWTTFLICLGLIGFGIYAGYSAIDIAKDSIKSSTQSEPIGTKEKTTPEVSTPPEGTEEETTQDLPNNTSATISSGILALLSAASFLGVFFLRPLDSLERNAILYPLVNGIVTMYWFQIAETNDNSKVKGIVADFVANLGTVLDKHNEATKKYAELLGAKKEEPPAEEEEEEEGAEKEKEKKEQEEKKASEDKKKEAGKKLTVAASFVIVGLLLARFFRVT